MAAAQQAVDAVVEGVKKVALGGDGKKGKKEKKGAANDAGDSGPLELNPPPSFLQERIELFDQLKKEYDADIAKKPREPITITMPDGTIKTGTSWETTPADIAKGISNSLFKRTVIARLDGDPEQLWDLERPLQRSCKLELLDFSHEQGRLVFWHSSAHMLGEAAERRWGCSLCIGPPLQGGADGLGGGFYYEMALPGGAPVGQTDWKPLETIVGKIVKERQKFERLEVSKENLLKMFAYNKYKQHIIKDKIPDGTSTTVYRNGPLIDLCRGPHVVDTGRVETFAIEKNSASYFLGDQNNDSLQRVYGISFPDKKLMAEHKKFLEEAAKRDHRRIAKDQELFFFHDLSPGSGFWLPHGARIYNKIIEMIREQYWKRDYNEVISPNMYNSELWKQSGHWEHYKDDMFVIDVEKEQWGLKPMNCPGHALMFAHRERSHRELPWRVAEFAVLHRNEASGALSGMTRVRRFQQDDAHIFAREDQIKSEVLGLFDFLREVYGIMGLKFKLRLSTRPEKYLGELETWNQAEDHLRSALDQFADSQGGVPWELNEGDGAFYGPKIDIALLDSLNREFQCATIQLDFQLPQRFGLEYMTAEGADAAQVAAAQKEKEAEAAAPPAEGGDKKERAIKKLSPGAARPVMIHRAMAGSIERFTAILCENFAGKWPFWLSPRQILVVPVGKGFFDYAEEVQRAFKRARLYCDVDLSGNTLQKKVRTGQLAQYNFIMVVGAEEAENRQVNVRNRDDPATQDRGQPISLDLALDKLRQLAEDKGNYNPFPAPAAAEKK